jgi:hypothetical protein
MMLRSLTLLFGLISITLMACNLNVDPPVNSPLDKIVFKSAKEQVSFFDQESRKVGDQLYTLFYSQEDSYQKSLTNSILKVPRSFKNAMNGEALKAYLKDQRLASYKIWISDFKQVVNAANAVSVTPDMVGRFYLATNVPNAGMDWVAKVDINLKNWKIVQVVLNNQVKGGWMPMSTGDGFMRVISENNSQSRTQQDEYFIYNDEGVLVKRMPEF